MSDHEFEKQVQQKMDEFRLRPSDAVWTEIAKNIRRGKRRRFWFWLPVIITGVSVGGYTWYAGIYSPKHTIPVAQPVSLSQPTAPARGIEKNEQYAKQNKYQAAVPNHSTHILQPAPGNNNEPVEPQKANDDQKPVTPSAAQPPQLVEPVQQNAASSETSLVATTPVHEQVYRKGHVPVFNKSGFSAFKRVNREIAGPDKKHRSEYDSFGDVQRNFAWATPETVSDPHAIATGNAMPGADAGSLFPFMMPDSASRRGAKMQFAAIQRKLSSPWHIGIEANVGFSRIAQNSLLRLKGLLGREDYLNEDLSHTTSNQSSSAGLASDPRPSNNTLTVVPVANVKASPIQPDYAFSAGVFVERAISKRFRLSAGLQYSYMSVYTTVGSLVKDSMLVSIGSKKGAVVPEYYTSPQNNSYSSFTNRRDDPGRRYTYRFQYFELPVMAHWQINKGRRLPPIVLNGGLSVSQLLSVDALHYDGSKGVYFKYDDLFNKTQFNFITGINVELFQKTKHPLWVGPDLRYSLSPLIKKDASSGRYLWSAGITFKMVLGRL